MSVLTVNETTDDRGAGKDSDGRDYRRSFIVLLDATVGPSVSDPLDARLAVGNTDFVQQPAYVGAPHPSDTSVYCLRVEPRQRRESRLTFDVVAEYSQYTHASEISVEDPLARPPKIGVGSAQYMKVLEYDYSDPPRAIVNAVGQPFDPGLEIPVSRPPLLIVQNELWVDIATMYGKVRTFDNTINSAPYQAADIGTLRVRIQTDQMFQTGTYNGAPYYSRVSYEFEHNPDGWQSEGKLLNQGMMQWVYRDQEWFLERIKGTDGEPVPDPWPLTMDGRALTRDEINAGSFTYEQFTAYRTTNFNELGL